MPSNMTTKYNYKSSQTFMFKRNHCHRHYVANVVQAINFVSMNCVPTYNKISCKFACFSLKHKKGNSVKTINTQTVTPPSCLS